MDVESLLPPTVARDLAHRRDRRLKITALGRKTGDAEAFQKLGSIPIRGCYESFYK
jgi:hypothetical protein